MVAPRTALALLNCQDYPDRGMRQCEAGIDSSVLHVNAAVVRDPWPGNGRRVLSPEEWYNTSFLARIRIKQI